MSRNSVSSFGEVMGVVVIGGAVGLAFLAFVAILVVLGAVSGGLALSLAWNWIMPGIWPDIVRLTIIQAIGLNLIVSTFTLGLARDKSDDNPWARLFVNIVVQPVFIILLAWIVSLLI